MYVYIEYISIYVYKYIYMLVYSISLRKERSLSFGGIKGLMGKAGIYLYICKYTRARGVSLKIRYISTAQRPMPLVHPAHSRPKGVINRERSLFTDREYGALVFDSTYTYTYTYNVCIYELMYVSCIHKTLKEDEIIFFFFFNFVHYNF